MSFTTCFGVSPSPPGRMACWAPCDRRCEQSVLLLLANIELSSILVSLGERRDVQRPRARCATHGSLYSALPTWGSPSAATASFLPGDEVDVNGPRARSATQGSLYSALPTWGSPSAANASFLQGDAQTCEWTASEVCHAWLPSLRPAYVGFSLRSKCPFLTTR